MCVPLTRTLAGLIRRPWLWLLFFGITQLQETLLWRGVLPGAWRTPSVLLEPALLAVTIAGVARLRGRARGALMAAYIGVTRLAPYCYAIVHRSLTGDIQQTHDGVLQTESAAQVLLRGMDPYGHDYSGTAMSGFPWTVTAYNPAIHHYAYMPLTILAQIPSELIRSALGMGTVDFRWVLLPFWLALALLIARLPLDTDTRLSLAAAALVDGDMMALWGVNDVLFLVPLIAAVLLLARNHRLSAYLLLGVALGFKQLAVVIWPLFLAWDVWRHRHGEVRRMGDLLWPPLAGACLALALIAPFLLWSPQAFWHDTVTFFSAGGPDNLPIDGPGLGQALLSVGVVHHVTDPINLLPVQLPLMALALGTGVRAILRAPSIAAVTGWYALTVAVGTIFGRVTHPNQLAVVVLLGMVSWAFAAAGISPRSASSNRTPYTTPDPPPSPPEAAARSA
jgi:hypothetical protein